jgi:hypothetical protein
MDSQEQHQRELEEHRRGPAHEPRPGEPSGGPDIPRVFAGIGLGISTLLLIGALTLVTFAQIFPAIFVFGMSLGLGLFSLAGLYREPKEDPDRVGPKLTVGERASAFVEPPDVDNPTDMSIAVWGASALLAAVFIAAAFLQLTNPHFVTAQYSEWDYPPVLRWTGGLIALFGAVALMVPRLAKFGALALLPLAFGAIYTFLVRGTASLAVFPLFVLLLLVFVLWEHPPTHDAR